MFFFLVNGEKLWQGLNREDYDVVSQWIDYYKNHSGKNYLVQKKYEYTENPTIQGMWHPFVNVEPEIATAKFPVVMLNHYSILSPQYVPMHYLLKPILKSNYLPYADKQFSSLYLMPHFPKIFLRY